MAMARACSHCCARLAPRCARLSATCSLRRAAMHLSPTIQDSKESLSEDFWAAYSNPCSFVAPAASYQAARALRQVRAEAVAAGRLLEETECRYTSSSKVFAQQRHTAQHAHCVRCALKRALSAASRKSTNSR